MSKEPPYIKNAFEKETILWHLKIFSKVPVIIMNYLFWYSKTHSLRDPNCNSSTQDTEIREGSGNKSQIELDFYYDTLRPYIKYLKIRCPF